jgi:hypothetical protein
MDCMECWLSPAPDIPRTAIGSCTYCGAGICLDHARVLTIHRQPIGVVPQSRMGARRIVCTSCYAGPSPEGAKAGMLTVSAQAPVRLRGR